MQLRQDSHSPGIKGDATLFLLLDSRLPSRLASAFPEGVDVQRLGLAEAVASTRAFLAQTQEGKE